MPYYTPSANPAFKSSLNSNTIRNEFNSIKSGFDAVEDALITPVGEFGIQALSDADTPWTLPVTAANGSKLIVYKSQSTGTPIVINAGVGHTINSSSTPYTLYAYQESVTFILAGTDWISV